MYKIDSVIVTPTQVLDCNRIDSGNIGLVVVEDWSVLAWLHVLPLKPGATMIYYGTTGGLVPNISWIWVWVPSPYKDGLYGDFHYKDKTVMISSYLYNGNPYTDKMASLYWDGPGVSMCTFKSHDNGLIQWEKMLKIYKAFPYWLRLFSGVTRK